MAGLYEKALQISDLDRPVSPYTHKNDELTHLYVATGEGLPFMRHLSKPSLLSPADCAFFSMPWCWQYMYSEGSPPASEESARFVDHTWQSREPARFNRKLPGRVRCMGGQASTICNGYLIERN